MRGSDVRRLIESFSKDMPFADAFECLFENASDAIYILDKRGNFVAINREAEELTGFKREDWIGKSFRKIIPAKSLPKAIKGFLGAIRGKPIRLELELKTAFKKNVLVEVTSKPLIINGKTVGTLGIARNITERKRAEEALRESEEKYRGIIELAPVAIVTMDLKGVITSCNTFMTLSGYSKDEIIGKRFSDIGFLQMRDLPKYLKMFSSIIRGKVPDPFEVSYRHKDGEPHVGEVYTSLMKKNGKIIGIQSVTMDITEWKKKERAIRENKEKFERLFMNNPEAAVYVDSDCHILDANPRFSQLFGYSLDEIKGKGLSDLIVPEDLKEEGEMLDREAKKAYTHYDTVRKKKDGTLVPVSISAAPIIVENQIIGYMGLYKDIIERKRFEERLSALNIYSRDLNMAGSMEDIYRVTLNAMEKTLGFEHAFFMVVDKDMLCVVDQRGYPVDLSIRLPLDGSKRGVSVKVASTGKPSNVPDAQKEDAWVEFCPGIRSGLDVPVKIGRKVLGVIGVDSKSLSAFDEKDQKLLEILASHAATAMSNLEHAKNLEAYAQEIRESQQKFERLFMDNPEAAVYVNPDFHILDVNPRFSELFGYSLDEVEGKHINSAIVPKDKMEEAEMLDKKAEKRYFFHDTVRKRKDGSLVPVSISVAPITVEGQLIGYVGLYKDVTERKQMEKKLQEYSEHLEELVEKRTRQLKDTQEQLLKAERLAAIGEMAAMVGHDLRNPLTGIAGATYYLKKKLGSKMDKKAREMLELVGKNVEYSDKIISDLLAYSREIRLELTDTTPKSIIEDALTLVKIPKSIRISDLTQNKPKIKVDVPKIERVFVNIIKNAIDALYKGGTLTITSEESNGNLEIAFTDTGIGIRKEILEKIWIPLFTTKAKGMGLGLPICKRIVEAHGGNISVESTVSKGTTFIVAIPIKPKLEGGEKIWVKPLESLLSTTTKA